MTPAASLGAGVILCTAGAPHRRSPLKNGSRSIMKNLEYVVAAYAIWCGVILVYMGYLFLKSRGLNRALARLDSSANSQSEQHQ